MSNRTLRNIYTGMVKARVLLGTKRGRQPGVEDVACWASTLVGLTKNDVVFGCRQDGVLDLLRGTARPAPVIAGGVERLYAALGAAMALRGGGVVTAFLERHEVEKTGWIDGLRLAAGLPLLIVVLPRWKGRESGMELCREARNAGVPGIPVDGADAVALYRVAQESLVRARADGGSALIEAVSFPSVKGHDGAMDAVELLGASLLRRGVATESWMERIGPKFAAIRDGMKA